MQLFKTKQAVSLMIAYVLLTVIALSIGAIVYTYLKGYLPSSLPECPADIAIAITSATCTSSKLDITIANRGLFTIKHVYVRAGDPKKQTRTSLVTDVLTLTNDLEPSGIKQSLTLTGSLLVPGRQYILEVQPAIEDRKRGVIPCKNAIVTQLVQCA